MPDRETMIAAVKCHASEVGTGDQAKWLAIWADDAEIEDPVGAPVLKGIEALRTTFWDQASRAAPRLTLDHDVIIAGNEAMAVMSVELGHEGAKHRMCPVVDLFTFNEAGKITSMRAFFNY